MININRFVIETENTHLSFVNYNLSIHPKAQKPVAGLKTGRAFGYYKISGESFASVDDDGVIGHECDGKQYSH